MRNFNVTISRNLFIKIIVVIFILDLQQCNSTPEELYKAENHELFERKSGLVLSDLERSRRNHFAQAQLEKFVESPEVNDDSGPLEKRQVQIPYTSSLLPRPISPVLGNSRQGSQTRFLSPRQSSAVPSFLNFEEENEEEEEQLQQRNPSGRNKIVTLRNFHPLPFRPGELQQRYQLLKPRNPGQNNFQLPQQQLQTLPLILNSPSPPTFISPQSQPLINRQIQLNSNYPVKTPVFPSLIQNHGAPAQFFIPFQGQPQFNFQQPSVQFQKPLLPFQQPSVQFQKPLVSFQQPSVPFQQQPLAPFQQTTRNIVKGQTTSYRIVPKTAPLYIQQPALLAPLGYHHHHHPGVPLNPYFAKQNPYAFQQPFNIQGPRVTFLKQHLSAPAPPNVRVITSAQPNYNNYNDQRRFSQAPPINNYFNQQRTTPVPPNYNYYNQNQGTTPAPPNYNYYDQRTTPAPPNYNYYNQNQRTTPAPPNYNYYDQRTSPAPPNYVSKRLPTQTRVIYSSNQDLSTSERQSGNFYNPNPPWAIQGNNGNSFQPNYLRPNDQRQMMESYHRMLTHLNRNNFREFAPAFSNRPQHQRTFFTERHFPKFFIIDRPNPGFPIIPLGQF